MYKKIKAATTSESRLEQPSIDNLKQKQSKVNSPVKKSALLEAALELSQEKIVDLQNNNNQ